MSLYLVIEILEKNINIYSLIYKIVNSQQSNIKKKQFIIKRTVDFPVA